jgi:hypothetical protein
VLLEGLSPRAAAAFAAVLPATGKATNTYASGPLTRFWNAARGRQDETPLDVPESEATASTLYGGRLLSAYSAVARQPHCRPEAHRDGWRAIPPGARVSLRW